jgi:hypothetical protein
MASRSVYFWVRRSWYLDSSITMQNTLFQLTAMLGFYGYHILEIGFT